MTKPTTGQRVALITGGAQGIGRAIAERFLKGSVAVVIADRNRSKGRRAASELSRWGDVRFLPLDVSSESQVRTGIDDVIRRHGRLDVLVNNAGIVTPGTGFDFKRWKEIVAVNLTGPFLCSKYAERPLRRSRGSIVNIASTRALMSEPGTQAYSASKGGLVALTHSLAVTMGPAVRVNCISPGWIDTRNSRLRPADHQQHPAGRVGLPRDIAELAWFLASPEAGFITGQNYVADGGMTKKMIYEE